MSFLVVESHSNFVASHVVAVVVRFRTVRAGIQVVPQSLAEGVVDRSAVVREVAFASVGGGCLGALVALSGVDGAFFVWV